MATKTCPIKKKKRLRILADQLWSLAVKKDWGDKCAVCGHVGKLHSHHLIPRQHTATRYDLRNGVALCRPCHIFNPHTSPHQNAAGWLQWFVDHHEMACAWYEDAVEYGDYKTVIVSKNENFYVGTILELRQYVEPEDFTRIVGVRFERWLDLDDDLE